MMCYLCPIWYLENRIDKKMKLIETGLVKITQHLDEGKEIKILPEKIYQRL